MEHRLPQFFFALSLVVLALMLGAFWQASTPSWKNYQQEFLQLESQGEPNAVTKATVLATPPQIHQVCSPACSASTAAPRVTSASMTPR